MERTVRVELGPRSYDVRVASGLVDALGGAVASLGSVSSAVVISDTNVAPLYAERAVNSLTKENVPAHLLTFPAGEPHKTLQTYGGLLDGVLGLQPPIDRDCVIVALGGGVVGDVAGFVAATALRGLRVVQCPTSLLAGVDSSVGGKTGVDHPTGKNLIGAFHQPSAVLVDATTLRSLPAAELGNGLAECVKHGVIRDPELLDFLESKADAILSVGEEETVELIARNVAIKATVVAADEREAGVRAHLNFGHTVGHAIEVLVGYDRMPHGKAVALGMVAANRMAIRRGLLRAEDAQRIRALLERLGLPVQQGGLDAEKVREVMQHDKKTRGGRLRMVLPTGLGSVEVFDDVTTEEVRDAVEALG
jgi:3-dehydroquinate synthase